jgi:aryl-alcohol dehydrogenase-like predicted oxidoreductase
LIAYQPLAMGALTGKYLDGNKPRGFRRFTPYFRGKNQVTVRSVVSLLIKIGESRGMQPSQVALRWLLEKEQVLPIPGVKNAAQVTSNAGALDFSLTAEEIQALDATSRPFLAI